MVLEQQVIKAYYEEGVVDSGSISMYYWPKTTQSRRDIKVWKVFIKTIYCRVRQKITWTLDENRYKRSTAKITKNG